jgi:hypothetical protein
MKRYLIPAAVAAVLLLLLWPHHRDDGTGSPASFETNQQVEAVANSKGQAGGSESADEVARAMTGSNSVSTNEDYQVHKAARFYDRSHNVPVTFYGQVVDQDNNALENVKVDLEVLEQYLEPVPDGREELTRLHRESGADGRFEVNGLVGRSVTIKGLTKVGYEPEREQKHYGIYGVQSGRFTDPIVFRMWSTNLHQPLISGKRSFQIVPDGTPYLIDLTKGTITNSGSGDLRVWIKAPVRMVRGQDYDWSCELDTPDGGLLEQPPGVAMCRAPAEGYVQTFKFQGRLKGGQEGSPGEKSFYVSLKNGKEYGAIKIELWAPYSEEIAGLVRLSYSINPSGSRLLR